MGTSTISELLFPHTTFPRLKRFELLRKGLTEPINRSICHFVYGLKAISFSAIGTSTSAGGFFFLNEMVVVEKRSSDTN